MKRTLAAFAAGAVLAGAFALPGAQADTKLQRRLREPAQYKTFGPFEYSGVYVKCRRWETLVGVTYNARPQFLLYAGAVPSPHLPGDTWIVRFTNEDDEPVTADQYRVYAICLS